MEKLLDKGQGQRRGGYFCGEGVKTRGKGRRETYQVFLRTEKEIGVGRLAALFQSLDFFERKRVVVGKGVGLDHEETRPARCGFEVSKAANAGKEDHSLVGQLCGGEEERTTRSVDESLDRERDLCRQGTGHGQRRRRGRIKEKQIGLVKGSERFAQSPRW